ncbi:MGMT family protein [Mangrovimicrobium sediminis]|uniref:MGMT family protein n=1 Tax=Mangrovimicrobium sediminis TaxID=2562682 RepID=A0A4Z0M328_9GAMM|nr:MGMT family protein [Haliea sp. SAOS-164]TGD74093.1 MGMT family protein [Haliea sp. SAOS-164]
MPSQPNEIDQRIWQVVALIPRGKVATYGDVAAQAGLPGAARRVGRALKGLPTDTRIPWHRVVNAAGRISLPGGAGRQRERLEAEGVEFHDSGRINLKRFRHRPSGADHH